MEKNMNDKDWLSHFKETAEYQQFLQRPIAYFCAEYALDSTLPTYAGGLGVLAGDFVREASVQNFPILAVGLRYRHAQSSLVSPDVSATEKNASEERTLTLVKNQAGHPLIVSVPIGERIVSAVAWEWQDNGARVYLLDCDIVENDSRDRGITDTLYTNNRTERLRQEILLGIGGYELLKALGHTPSGYHLNEGHSAFLACALMRHEMERQRVDFNTAYHYARKHILFTNHTLVLEGQEQFNPALVREQISRYVREMGIACEDVIRLGMTDSSLLFSMTTFAFRLSTRANAVSALHASKATLLWSDHPMETVTNGIHTLRWDKIKNENMLWHDHQENKMKLLKRIFEMTGQTWNKDTLLFGWARRLVEYKQPLVLFSDIEKLRAIASDPKQPLCIVYSGPTGTDVESNPYARELKKIMSVSLAGTFVFLPNYNTTLAEELVAGCDVWLNTPMVGKEACGTSGMKAALNGVLPLSTRDGWIAEADMADCGWVIDEPDSTRKLLDTAKEKIIPLYYEHLKNPLHSEWYSRMASSRKLILERFTMLRVLREYIEKLYIPVVSQKHPLYSPE